MQSGGDDCGEVDVAGGTGRKAPAAVAVLRGGQGGKGGVDIGEVGGIGGFEGLQRQGGIEEVVEVAALAPPAANSVAHVEELRDFARGGLTGAAQGDDATGEKIGR